MKASLQHNGIFYAGTCLVFMFVLLPGAGLFGEVAEWAEYSEAGREAEQLFGAKLLSNYAGASDDPALGAVPATAEAKV